MAFLHPLHPLADGQDGITTFLQFWRYNRLYFGLLLENEARKKGNNFFGLIGGKGVFEDQFGQDEFAGRVDL